MSCCSSFGTLAGLRSFCALQLCSCIRGSSSVNCSPLWEAGMDFCNELASCVGSRRAVTRTLSKALPCQKSSAAATDEAQLLDSLKSSDPTTWNQVLESSSTQFRLLAVDDVLDRTERLRFHDHNVAKFRSDLSYKQMSKLKLYPNADLGLRSLRVPVVPHRDWA